MYTLPIHCCIDGLRWLVCFSGVGFADHVKSWLIQWGPWRALYGRKWSDIHPCISEASLKALQVCLDPWLLVLGPIATPSNHIGGYNPPLASHSPLTSTPPPTAHPSPYYAIHYITVVVKKFAQNPAVLASYYWWLWNTSPKTLL